MGASESDFHKRSASGKGHWAPEKPDTCKHSALERVKWGPQFKYLHEPYNTRDLSSNWDSKAT